MNLDFDRPMEKLKKMAEQSKIDLKDSRVLLEFKLIQQHNLEDIRRMKAGKPRMTEEEKQEMRTKAFNELDY